MCISGVCASNTRESVSAVRLYLTLPVSDIHEHKVILVTSQLHPPGDRDFFPNISDTHLTACVRAYLLISSLLTNGILSGDLVRTACKIKFSCSHNDHNVNHNTQHKQTSTARASTLSKSNERG